jgi:hypothetical protein
MALRRIEDLPWLIDDKNEDDDRREAQENEGEQEALQAAARSLLLMPFMLRWVGMHSQGSLSSTQLVSH